MNSNYKPVHKLTWAEKLHLKGVAKSIGVDIPFDVDSVHFDLVVHMLDSMAGNEDMPKHYKQMLDNPPNI